MKPSPLSPHGTARVRFLGAAGLPEDLRADEEFRVRILSAGEAVGLSAERLFLASELARWQPGLEPAERRSVLLLALAALVSLEEGSTRLAVQGEAGRRHLGRLALEIAGGDGEGWLASIDRLLASGRLGEIVGGPDDDRPLVLASPHVYLHRMYALERDVAANLVATGARTLPRLDLDGALAAVLGSSPSPLSAEQAAAVRTALESPVAVVSGGPGTGKTSVVVSILRTLGRLGLPPERIALAAPTGKAANRMLEALRSALGRLPHPDAFDRRLLEAPPEARTLHRLLGYSPTRGRFRHHERNRLPEDVVIVDEASMVDLSLMDRLVRALGREARLVLLGDADQLPSVAAGAVLRDLVGTPAAGPARVARLSHSYRMDAADPAGREILTVALALNEGRIGPALRRIATAAEAAFHGVEILDRPADDDAARREFLRRWYAARVRDLPGFAARVERAIPLGPDGFAADEVSGLDVLFRHLEGSRILTLTRALPTGSDRVNDVLHALAAETARVPAAWDLVPGEPVLVERNDYERNLYNGDQGVVLRVLDPDAPEDSNLRLRAVFRGGSGFVAYPLPDLRGRLSRAHAITVHKSQGSEYDHVALLLPDPGHPLLCREILYTAVTRSRRSVTIGGELEALRRGAGRPLPRESGLAERLAGG